MAGHVTFDSGSFTISSYLDKNFVLAVSTRMTLAVPDPFFDNSTVADLRDQVQNGSLWIARAGSCRIELEIGFGESLEVGQRDGLKRMCIEAFENFNVWGTLGLDVRREYNQFSEIRGSRLLYPYSVQHKQQNSGLIAPDQVPCAYLSTLNCIFTFGSKSTLMDKSNSNIRIKPREPNLSALNGSPRSLRGITTTDQHLIGFAGHSTPPPGMSKVITLKAHPGDLRRILGVPEIWSLPRHLQEKRLEHLVHTAMHLVLGSRRRFSGIQFLKKSESPPALDVAPAVWSSRYFQDVVSRAQLTSFVSSALADLVSTEVPSLRHKVQNLGFDPAQEIRRRMLLLVLRSARVPKIQMQEQRTDYQSQIKVNAVAEDDRSYGLNNSQEEMEDQEQQGLPEPRQDGRPLDLPSFYTESNMDPHFGGSDLTHEETSTIDNDPDVNEEPGLEYRMPSSGSRCSITQSMSGHLEDLGGYDSNQRLAGRSAQVEGSHGPQGDNDEETQGNLKVDSTDEDYIGHDMEESGWLDHRDFEEGLPWNDNWDQCVIDAHVYGENVESGHGHRAHLDAEPQIESKMAGRPRFLESDEAEGAGDEHNDRSYWQQQILMMGSDNFLLPRETDYSQSGFDDHLIENHYDTNSLDCAMD